MPHWYSSHGGLGHLTSHSNASSQPGSRPSSRPPSPTRSASHSSGIGIAIPSRSNTTDSTDPLSDFEPTSAVSTSAYGPSTGSSDMWGGSSGAQTPGNYFPGGPVEIVLDSEHLVMRGQGGDMNPAYLSGRIELNLQESTNIKDITMNLTGKAKVNFSDAMVAKNHHYTHNIFTHDWSFLQGDKRHTHTLKAGHHSFPFSLMLDGHLPASLQTYQGDGVISYKLHAIVVRSSFASNFHSEKTFTLHRTFTSDALEFNQTLEIENTWPGKVMYALTLPLKAYAAGDDIPVNVKFMPLAKGVRVLSVTSVIKEYTLVHTRHSSHPQSRMAGSVKHDFRTGQAVVVAEEPVRRPPHFVETPSLYSSTSVSRAASRPPSPSRTPMPNQRGSWEAPPAESYFPGGAGPSSGVTDEPEEDAEIGDDEVNTQFSIPIPAWTTPSHTVHPIFVSHKLKWSCAISNPDGHISELRCALPIIILDHSLLEEARQAGAQTRGLLFGGTADDAQQVDLPSYQSHVYDRVATADAGNATGFLPRAVHGPPILSPHTPTPPHSRPPSRPGSPSRGLSRSYQNDGDEVPPRRELSQWADDELLRSLGALRSHSNGSSPHDTPAASRGPSRPRSRRNSRSGGNSNNGSRASSPERERADSLPTPERRGSGLQGLLHLPGSFKPLKPLSATNKPILRNTSGVALHNPTPNEGLHRNAQSFTNLPANAAGRISFAHQPQVPGTRRFTLDGPDNPEPLNQVPSYAIASRGFLGGGVVPLNGGPPMYDDSERQIVTHRSETDLPRPMSDTALAQLGSGVAPNVVERPLAVDQAL